MQRSKFFLYLIALSLSIAPMTAVADTEREKTGSSARLPMRILRAPIGTIELPGIVSFNVENFSLVLPGARSSTVEVQQVGPRKYIIKPLNLGINSEIRARSTRNLQVRVTDENDRPVPDAPVLFLLSNGGTGSGSVGSFAGQTSLRAMTNSQGIAQVDYSAGEIAGSTTKIKAQVEGTDAIWEGTLLIISALVAVSAPQSEPQLTPQSVPQSAPQSATQPSPQSAPQSATQPSPQSAPQSATQPSPQPSPQNAVLIFNSPVIGQMPKSSVARQTFTRTDGKKFTLQSLHGKVIVLHFFGVWCDTSKRQVESIRNILARYNSEELEVVGMSVKDPRSTPQALLQFITDLKVTYSVVQDVEDKHFVKFVDSKNVSVPQTLIYNRDGRLIGHHLGFNPQVGTEIERIIKGEFVK